MKKIKFRVWDKGNSRWVKLAGFKIQDGQLFPYEWRTINDLKSDKWVYIPEDVEVMQCAGLKDKNGKECYVADLIEDKNGRKYECKMHNDYLEIYFDEVPKGISLTPYGLIINGGTFEIIGNIYESPELLNSEQELKTERRNGC